jgi:hypothetical protein
MGAHGLRWSESIAAIAALTLALAGCGGGGMSSNDSGTPGIPALGPATVDISIVAASPVTAASPVSAASPFSAADSALRSTDSGYRWPWEIRDTDSAISHVYVEVVKVSLMPAEEPYEGEEMEGDLADGNPSGPYIPKDKPRFVSIVPDSPVVIDLLQLENGNELARITGRVDRVPVGTFDKIRVHYRDAKVVLLDGSVLRFHPTAHSKFDIRFRAGHELVIPAVADTTKPGDWTKYFRVKIDVVGIKIKILAWGKWWRGCKVILRPQIFAEAIPPALDGVTGTADQVIVGSDVPPVYGSFNVTLDGSVENVAVAFDNNTTWTWRENISAQSRRTVGVSNAKGAASLRDGAIVEIVGDLDSGNIFQAREILLTFPKEITGEVAGGWNLDHFFQLRLPTGDSVYPMPKWNTAYYDNAAAPFAVLTDAAIVDGAVVTARGYPLVFGGVEAYWISVGP